MDCTTAPLRRRFSAALLLVGMLLVACVATADERAGDERPNFILIVVDDMGWADLSCYGQDAYETPHLDAMAREGLRFTQAYSGCTVCAPARSTLMTGRHMGRTAVRGNTGGIPLPDQAVTLAEVLQAAGYRTGGFGKWGLGDFDTEGVPERQGFETFFGYYHQIHAHSFYPDYLIDTGKRFPLPGNAGFQTAHPGAGPKPSRSEGRDRQFSHYLIQQRMFEWIREHHAEPFLCYAPWTPPHARYEIPADDPAWQAVADKPWPMNARIHAAFNLLVDRHVGDLLGLLEELDIDDRTLVVFASDNGASNRFEGTLDSSGPWTGFKRSMHEGGLRVPLIARWPGQVPAGEVSDLPTYFPDWMPTLAELAGAEDHLPEGVDGISIAPSLLGRPALQVRHEFMYWEWPRYDWSSRNYSGRLMQAVRYHDWKALRDNDGEPWRLYHLGRDPAEENDLADEHPEIIARIAHWVSEHRTEPPRQREPEMPEGRRYR